MNRIINSSLSKAIYNDDIEELRYLLKIGKKCNIQDNTGWTPLHSAIQKNRFEMVELILLQPDAPINTQCFEGESPLYLACSTKSSSRIISSLLIAGANPNLPNNEDVTPLHIVTDPKIVEILLTFGADVNKQDFNNYTPLHNAIEKNNVEIAEILIKAGADTNLCELNGLTPLMLSFQFNYREIEPLLEATDNIDIVAKDGWSALMLAINAGKIDIAYKLIEKDANVNIVADSYTPLHLAVLKQEEQLFQLLWEKVDSKMYKYMQDLPHLMLIHRWYVPERLEYFFNVLETNEIFSNDKNQQSFLEFLFRFDRDSKLEMVICDIVTRICYSQLHICDSIQSSSSLNNSDLQQNCITHPQNCSSHLQICNLHKSHQICKSHLQNSDSHHQNCNLHPQNCNSHPRNCSLHRQNCNLHLHNSNSMQICNSNPQNYESQLQNCDLHSQNNLLQLRNSNSHSPKCSLYLQNCNLNLPNCSVKSQNCNSHHPNCSSHPKINNSYPQICNLHRNSFKINSQSLICFIENFSNCQHKFKLIDILLQSGVATFDNKLYAMVAVTLDPEMVPKLLTLTLSINPIQIFRLFTKEVRMDMSMFNLLIYLLKFCTPRIFDANRCLQKLKLFNPYSAKRVKYTLNGINPISQVQMSRIVDYEITPEDREVMCDIYNKVEKILVKKIPPSLKEFARDTIRNKMYLSQKYIKNCDSFFKNYGLPRDIIDIITLKKSVNSF